MLSETEVGSEIEARGWRAPPPSWPCCWEEAMVGGERRRSDGREDFRRRWVVGGGGKVQKMRDQGREEEGRWEEDGGDA